MEEENPCRSSTASGNSATTRVLLVRSAKIQVLRYLYHLVLCQDRRTLIEYPLPPWARRTSPFTRPARNRVIDLATASSSARRMKSACGQPGL